MAKSVLEQSSKISETRCGQLLDALSFVGFFNGGEAHLVGAAVVDDNETPRCGLMAMRYQWLKVFGVRFPSSPFFMCPYRLMLGRGLAICTAVRFRVGTFMGSGRKVRGYAGATLEWRAYGKPKCSQFTPPAHLNKSMVCMVFSGSVGLKRALTLFSYVGVV